LTLISIESPTVPAVVVTFTIPVPCPMTAESDRPCVPLAWAGPAATRTAVRAVSKIKRVFIVISLPGHGPKPELGIRSLRY